MQFRRVLRPLHLTAVIFFTVSGGPYGLEPLIQEVGRPLAMVLVLVIPVIWSLPVILMVLELNGMMPREGGYYQWVKTAMGLRWGFLEGWWTWLFGMTDLAIYPVLFVQYLKYFVPGAEEYKIPLYLAVIWICVLINLRGALTTGRGSVTLGAAVLAPFLLLFAAALFRHPSVTAAAGQASVVVPVGLAAMSAGLFNVMWNFLGWDNAFTIAEEVHVPLKSYLTATSYAMVIIVAIYFFTILAGGSVDPGVLEEQGYPALGLRVGGWWLGALLAAGGIGSVLGLFLSTLLVISRVPKVMADDGLLVKKLSQVHHAAGVPHVAIIGCAIVVSFMVLWNFGELLIIDVTLYSAALIPEFIALIVLRKKAPDAGRPFRIPLGSGGLIVMTIVPTLCIAGAVAGMLSSGSVHPGAVYFALAAVGTGPLALMAVRRLRPE